MIKAHEKLPQYGWDKNKGYPSLGHKLAMMEFGTSELHRKSFKWKNPQQEFDF
jgi:ribonuclease HII